MARSDTCRRRLFLKAWIFLCMMLNAVMPQSADEGLSTCEIEALVRQLTDPSPEYQMHAAALRSQLRNLLNRQQPEQYQSIDFDYDSSESDKRSIGSLARGGLLNGSGKRNIGALARTNSLQSQLDTLKRSLATLAKNGQLPSREPDYSDSNQQWSEKRNLGSTMRSGFMASGKRNVAALARDFQLPSSSSSTGKRNLAALARDGLVPSTTPKRSMASLARAGSMPTYKREYGNYYWWDDLNSNEAEKRNLGSLKGSPVHGTRQKRDIGDDLEIADPVLQNAAPYDYDELQSILSRVYGPYYGTINNQEKRFLGSVARSGWYQYRPMDKRNLQSLARNGYLRYDLSKYVAGLNGRDSYRQQEQKRHIGSVARSGWWPAFRPIRSGRFSRSGRARSQTDGYYLPQERLRQPIVGDCRRCDTAGLRLATNSLSWGAPGLQTNWGTPPRLTALHWRSLRRTEPYY